MRLDACPDAHRGTSGFARESGLHGQAAACPCHPVGFCHLFRDAPAGADHQPVVSPGPDPTGSPPAPYVQGPAALDAGGPARPFPDQNATLAATGLSPTPWVVGAAWEVSLASLAWPQWMSTYCCVSANLSGQGCHVEDPENRGPSPSKTGSGMFWRRHGGAALDHATRKAEADALLGPQPLPRHRQFRSRCHPPPLTGHRHPEVMDVLQPLRIARLAEEPRRVQYPSPEDTETV